MIAWTDPATGDRPCCSPLPGSRGAALSSIGVTGARLRRAARTKSASASRSAAAAAPSSSWCPRSAGARGLGFVVGAVRRCAQAVSTAFYGVSGAVRCPAGVTLALAFVALRRRSAGAARHPHQPYHSPNEERSQDALEPVGRHQQNAGVRPSVKIQHLRSSVAVDRACRAISFETVQRRPKMPGVEAGTAYGGPAPKPTAASWQPWRSTSLRSLIPLRQPEHSWRDAWKRTDYYLTSHTSGPHLVARLADRPGSAQDLL